MAQGAEIFFVTLGSTSPKTGFVGCAKNSGHSAYSGTADIFRGFMVSLYVKGKENGHVQAYAPTGAMVLK